MRNRVIKMRKLAAENSGLRPVSWIFRLGPDAVPWN